MCIIKSWLPNFDYKPEVTQAKSSFIQAVSSVLMFFTTIILLLINFTIVDTTKKQINIMADTFQTDNRPLIFISDINYDTSNRLVFNFKNVGKLPGKVRLTQFVPKEKDKLNLRVEIPEDYTYIFPNQEDIAYRFSINSKSFYDAIFNQNITFRLSFEYQSILNEISKLYSYEIEFYHDIDGTIESIPIYAN